MQGILVQRAPDAVPPPRYSPTHELGRLAVTQGRSGLEALQMLGKIWVALGRAILDPRRLRLTSVVRHLFETGVQAIPKEYHEAAEVFGATHAEIRVGSGALANLYGFMALAKPGDAIIAPPPAVGGHVTHHADGCAGLYGLVTHPAPINADGYTVDLGALREMALRLTAEHVDKSLRQMMRDQRVTDPWKAGERMLVAVGPSPHAEALELVLLQYAQQLGLEL